MLFQTLGEKDKPAILFFHAMGVTGDSSVPVAQYLKERYFCVMPTSTVYCWGEQYISKQDEIKQIEEYLHESGVEELSLVVASSLGADLAVAFLSQTEIPVHHAFFDGGQFAQISKGLRRLMVPFLYFTIKSLYWTKGATLGKIMWCSNDSIKPYFIHAGKNLRYANLRRQMMDSLEMKAFPALSEQMQKNSFFEFGSEEEHYKYREAVMKAYPHGSFPVFQGHNHMQFQICDAKGFAEMLDGIIRTDALSIEDIERQAHNVRIVHTAK